MTIHPIQRSRRALGFAVALIALLLAATRHTPAVDAASLANDVATSDYVTDQAQNTWTYAVDTTLHPGSRFQNLLGYGLAVGTVGDRAQGDRGSWTLYENASGLGVLLPALFDQRAITVGNVVFADGRLPSSGELYWHERRHYEQSTRFGPLFAPAYLATHLTHGYEDSPFEVDARDWGRQRARQGRLA